MSADVARTARPGGRDRQGIVSGLAILAASFTVASVLPTAGVAGFALVLVALSAWLAPDALRRMAGWRVLAVLVLLGGVSWLGQSIAAAAGAPGQVGPAALALHIVMRVGLILLAVGLVAYSLPLEQFAAGLERLGLRNFGFAMGVAVNALPVALATLQQTWRALKLRRPYAKGRLHAWRLAATTVVAHMLTVAEDTVAAAMARGYDPDRRRKLPVLVTGLDAVFATSAAIVIAYCVYWAATN